MTAPTCTSWTQKWRRRNSNTLSATHNCQGRRIHTPLTLHHIASTFRPISTKKRSASIVMTSPQWLSHVLSIVTTRCNLAPKEETRRKRIASYKFQVSQIWSCLAHITSSQSSIKRLISRASEYSNLSLPSWTVDPLAMQQSPTVAVKIKKTHWVSSSTVIFLCGQTKNIEMSIELLTQRCHARTSISRLFHGATPQVSQETKHRI